MKYVVLVLLFSIINLNWSEADLSSNVQDYINDAEQFIEDVEDAVDDALNDDLDRLMLRTQEFIDIAQDLYDAANSDGDLKNARKWAKVAVQYAMDAITDPLVLEYDTKDLARKRYEKVEEEMDDKKNTIEDIVYGSEYGGNQLASDVFEAADGYRDLAKDFEDVADYRKAYYIAIQTKALYNKAKKIAKSS